MHMHHDHSHQHHEIKRTDLNRALYLGILLNVIFVIIETGAGFWLNSLSLLSDAGHNFGDVISLVLALLAFKLLEVKPNKQYTYGLRKTTIIASLTNALLLMVAVGAILFKSFDRFFNPVEISGEYTALVAGVGILINGFTAWLFFRGKEHDLNIKGAYLHMLADTLVSAGVVVSGLVIYYTDLYIIDTILSFFIGGAIFYSTWGLLKESLRLNLDAVPKDVNLDAIKAGLNKHEDVSDVHHMHVWALSTTENALTAHIVVKTDLSLRAQGLLRAKLRHLLAHQQIHHATLEFELEGQPCPAHNCSVLLESEHQHDHPH